MGCYSWRRWRGERKELVRSAGRGRSMVKKGLRTGGGAARSSRRRAGGGGGGGRGGGGEWCVEARRPGPMPNGRNGPCARAGAYRERAQGHTTPSGGRRLGAAGRLCVVRMHTLDLLGGGRAGAGAPWGGGAHTVNSKGMGRLAELKYNNACCPVGRCALPWLSGGRASRRATGCLHLQCTTGRVLQLGPTPAYS